ncbi:Hint domain-containing protein [Aliiruegeria lutimaris]|uniref:Hint domain-containing protein n=1 Tax=Aliiruegeria lutimaris TaxID=571298 RepID=A0A1G8PIC4_9RHOB|nr:Hint domain-containing protein [Aliiruegeria lutimaris]SDI92066.1 Hint domain-containing protein [Aliiruegeria lutimaris]
MGTGLTGTFVLRWSQTRVDGFAPGTFCELGIGASWRWSGQAFRMDGPDGIARLGVSREVAELHRRAAGKARRICGRVVRLKHLDAIEIDDEHLMDRCIVLTDGVQVFVAIHVPAAHAPDGLLVFLGDLPPADTDFWIARITTNPRADARARRQVAPPGGGLAAGTAVETPQGLRDIAQLEPGDMVLTRDDGPQRLGWVSHQRISGARMHLDSRLRPVRIAAGALGEAGPREALLVSPGHRLLLAGSNARTLYSESGVFVRAGDLLGLPGVSTALDCTAVGYVSLMLERHHVLTAAGLAVESFFPDRSDMAASVGAALSHQSGSMPSAADFGPPARRCLDPGEAAILTAGYC